MLPPIYEKARRRFPDPKVDLIVRWRLWDAVPPARDEQGVVDEYSDRFPLYLYNRVWIEVGGKLAFGVWCEISEDFEHEDGTVWNTVSPSWMMTFDKKGRPIDTIREDRLIYSLSNGTAKSSRAAVMAAAVLMRTLNLIWHNAQIPGGTAIDSGICQRARVYEQAPDDAFKVIRMHALALNGPREDYEAPEPGSSGIRKRDHAVAGHWRRYPSGKSVWIKSHRRGDPDLGTVTKIIEV